MKFLTSTYNDDTRPKNQEPNVEVYVVTHKPIDFALPDYCKKIQVNAEANGQWPGYLHDNDNPDNISLKNPYYCELTALYSMWKNSTADIQGLFHYRRFIGGIDTPQKSLLVIPVPNIRKNAISKQKIIEALKDSDLIVSFPYAPYPLNALEDLRIYVYWKDIQAMYSVIREYYPDYLPSLKHILSLEHISYCNVFIARREFTHEYCTWLFDVLGKIEDRISFDGYDTQHKRVLGYTTEVLLNVYIHKHNLKCKYFQFVNPYGVNPLTSYARSALKKIIPVGSLISDILIPGRKKFRRKSSLRCESMQRFLAGEKSDIVGKITNASELEEHMKSKALSDVETHEDNGLLYAFGGIDYEDCKIILASFVLKNGADIHSFIGTVKDVIRDKEVKCIKGTFVFPRVICEYEIPDSAKESFAEEGITITRCQ